MNVCTLQIPLNNPKTRLGRRSGTSTIPFLTPRKARLPTKMGIDKHVVFRRSYFVYRRLRPPLAAEVLHTGRPVLSDSEWDARATGGWARKGAGGWEMGILCERAAAGWLVVSDSWLASIVPAGDRPMADGYGIRLSVRRLGLSQSIMRSRSDISSALLIREMRS